MHETLSFIPKTVKEKKKKKNNDAVTRAPEQTPRLLRVSPVTVLDVGGKGAQAFRGISSQLRLFFVYRCPLYTRSNWTKSLLRAGPLALLQDLSPQSFTESPSQPLTSHNDRSILQRRDRESAAWKVGWSKWGRDNEQAAWAGWRP